MGIYGPQHKVTQLALDEGFAMLGQILACQPSVSLGVADDHLLCDEQMMEGQSALLRILIRRLNALGVSSFELRRGMLRDEFDRLLLVLGTSSGGETVPGDTLADAIRSGGLEHLHLKRMSYQVVSEDDVIVKKNAVEELSVPIGAPNPPAPPSLGVEIVAILRRQEDSGGAALSGPAAEELAAQPDKLAELVLRAADIRPGMAQLTDGETLGNMVVGCLHRLHDQLASAPARQTKQGKRELGRSLVLLEPEVVEKLRELAGDDVAAIAAATIKAAVDGMVSDIRMDALAADYLRKRKQAVSTEQQLTQFIAHRQGDPGRAAELQDLQNKLTSGGLDPAAWDLLLLKSAQAKESGGAGTGAPPLTTLLMQLTELLSPANRRDNTLPPREQVGAVVSQLNYGVTRAIAGVAQKFGDLRSKAMGIQPLPEQAPSAEMHKQALLRKDMLSLLAEIVQELRQPMSVIISVIDMLNTGRLGAVPDAQRDMLNLAHQNGRRLCAIVDTLAGISGMPASLQPDTQMLGHIYRE